MITYQKYNSYYTNNPNFGISVLVGSQPVFFFRLHRHTFKLVFNRPNVEQLSYDADFPPQIFLTYPRHEISLLKIYL